MNNIIKTPLLPDTIHFHHTIDNDKTEVMRITKDGVWVNPEMQVDDIARAVLTALDSQIKVMVQRAVEDDRSNREWVGLTDEEVMQLVKTWHGSITLAIAIEAKLREKNA